MSAVVLRCPNCGTTQGVLGECEACHEAGVRYFCTNHTPGRWLDDPQCYACGARFGVDAPAPRAPAPSPPPRAGRAAPLPPALSPSVGRRAPGPTRPPPPAPVRRGPVERTRERSRDDAFADDAFADDAFGDDPFGDDIRDRGTRAPALPRGRPGFPIDLPPGLPTRFPGRAPDLGGSIPGVVRVGASSLVGCLGRLAMLALVAIVLLTVAIVALAGGGNVRTWVVDFGQQVGVVDGVPAQTERGIAAYRAGDRALAERELGEAARSYPRSALALLYLARLRIDAGDDYRARAYLTEAARREPESALVRRTLGEYGCALAARGQAAEAAEVAAQAGPGPWARCGGAGGGAAAP